jgi:hypothetical protein
MSMTQRDRSVCGELSPAFASQATVSWRVAYPLLVKLIVGSVKRGTDGDRLGTSNI